MVCISQCFFKSTDVDDRRSIVFHITIFIRYISSLEKRFSIRRIVLGILARSSAPRLPQHGCDASTDHFIEMLLFLAQWRYGTPDSVRLREVEVDTGPSGRF